MIRFELSKTLAKPLSAHLRPPQEGAVDLIWRADAALIGSDLCVVAQEQYSQYIMVFCGLRSEDFANFPQLFCDRFWREAAAICKQAGLHDTITLAKQLQAMGKEQCYQLDREPLEEGKLTKTIEKLERRLLYDRLPLPTDGKAAFEFSFAINSKKSASQQQAGQPSAAEVFGDLCLNLIDAALEAKGAQQTEDPVAHANVVSIQNNIVTVDFARQRRR